MKIGIIGGVGRMGEGLALRLAKHHDLLITSRNYEKAIQTAAKLESIALGFQKNYMQGSIKGSSDEDAIKQSEIVIVSIPADSTLSVIQELKGYFREDQIVISPIVSMKKSEGIFRHTSLVKLTSNNTFAADQQKSAAELIQEIIKQANVVSAFHTVPAGYLTNLDEIQNIDVFVASNSDIAIDIVSKLICEIPNLRPLKVGPLENSRQIESMVPLLLNAAVFNDLEEPSIRVIPWLPTSYGPCI